MVSRVMYVACGALLFGFVSSSGATDINVVCKQAEEHLKKMEIVCAEARRLKDVSVSMEKKVVRCGTFLGIGVLTMFGSYIGALYAEHTGDKGAASDMIACSLVGSFIIVTVGFLKTLLALRSRSGIYYNRYVHLHSEMKTLDQENQLFIMALDNNKDKLDSGGIVMLNRMKELAEYTLEVRRDNDCYKPIYEPLQTVLVPIFYK